MTTSRARWIYLLASVVSIVATNHAVAATAAQKCGQSKNKEAGKYTYCRQKVEARFAVLGDSVARTAGLQKCRDKYDGKWPLLESKATTAGDVCPSVGDRDDIRDAADTFTSDVASALAGGTLPNCPGDLATCQSDLAACELTPNGQPLKTGQTQCWDAAFVPTSCGGTGQDGETQRGLARSYVDNGDGTITDERTGLMWEKLSSFDGSVNDSEDTYTWQTAVTVKIGALNGSAFAGHTDWRLPNQFELYSLLDLGAITPAVSAAFDTACSSGCSNTTCSCTLSDLYWSSTTYQDGTALAWYVDFANGYVGAESKASSLRVRAVRGGS
jgi:hypothetical protein